MVNYEHADVPVRSNFAQSHQRLWDRLSRPGTWWTSAERIDIAAESRRARDCDLCAARQSALSPHSVEGEHDRLSALSEPAVEAIHAIVSYSSRLTRSWYEAVRARGLSDGHYVEIVGIVTSVLSTDEFCRGLGLPLHTLPEPGEGEPSRYRSQHAGPDEAWVPLVPRDNAGTPEADLWPSGSLGNIIRAMSLVPDEVRTLRDLLEVHYVPFEKVREPNAGTGALTRPQMELVAAKVSVLNNCYF
jgi:hypothetical protein|tara:strand:- start:879 stop:1613 length:735 start_codon:yes stop_codon:yes gene_type:complete